MARSKIIVMPINTPRLTMQIPRLGKIRHYGLHCTFFLVAPIACLMACSESSKDAEGRELTSSTSTETSTTEIVGLSEATGSCESTESCFPYGYCVGAFDPIEGSLVGAPVCSEECIVAGDRHRYCIDDLSCCGSASCSSSGLCEAVEASSTDTGGTNTGDTDSGASEEGTSPGTESSGGESTTAGETGSSDLNSEVTN